MVIWGNHEPYGSVWAELRASEERQLSELRARGLDIRVLHDEATEISGVRIIGATLWTVLELDPDAAGLAKTIIPSGLNDYRQIEMAPGNTMTAKDMLKMHDMDKAAIFTALSKPHDGPKHHLPIGELIGPRRSVGSEERRALNAGFASDLWEEIRAFDIHTWICGHSHDNRSFTVDGNHGPIHFVMNTQGYPNEGTAFDPTFVLSRTAPVCQKNRRAVPRRSDHNRARAILGWKLSTETVSEWRTSSGCHCTVSGSKA